jgi:hypothetical protein
MRVSKKVTETSLLSALKGVEDGRAMEAKRNEQNSLGLTTDHDVYEIVPARTGTALI